jgi:DNA polymerase I
MEHWDVRLLTGSYSIENDEPVVELFGRTRKNESIAIRYKGFKPYFHVLATKETVASILDDDPDVLGMEEIKLFSEGKDRTATKVIVRIPATVPRYRSKIQNEGYTVLAG